MKTSSTFPKDAALQLMTSRTFCARVKSSCAEVRVVVEAYKGGKQTIDDASSRIGNNPYSTSFIRAVCSAMFRPFFTFTPSDLSSYRDQKEAPDG